MVVSKRATAASGVPGDRGRVLAARADRLLMEAVGESDPRERFLAAYLAALRGAGAVIAALDPVTPRRGSRSAWVLLTKAAPEFVMWADYFADHSATRAALEAGISRPIDAAAADDFAARVGAFLRDVEDLIGDQSRLPGGLESA